MKKKPLVLKTPEDLARESFAAYVKYLNPQWKIPEFHKSMMNDLASKDGCLISMPPDHAKSTIASVLYSTWHMGNNPNHGCIIAVGAPKLKAAFAIQIRKVMESEKYKKLFQLKIRRDSDGKMMFHTLQGGQFLIVSKGEAIAGIRANLIIFDDIVGGAKEAMSKVEREKAWVYVTSDLMTREDKTFDVKVIGVGTRWHKEDVLCRIDKHESFKHLKVIKYKAISDDGKALWPERHNLQDLESKKKTLGTSAFNALYQQDPGDEEGTVFKREWLLKTYKIRPERFDRVVQSWDATFSKSETSDFVVGTTWGRIGAQFYLLDMVRARMNYPETKLAVKAAAAKWPQAFKKIIEKKANGAALIDDLAKEVSGLVPYVPTENKISRANAISPLFEAGNVILPDPSIASWVGDFIEELTSFPNASHDDCVDSTSQGLIELSANGDWISGMTKK